MTVTEIEAIESLDFDYSIECDIKVCGNDAQWKLVRVCCEEVRFFCGECKDLMQQWVEQCIMFTTGVRCNTCGAELRPKVWTDAYKEITRI